MPCLSVKYADGSEWLVTQCEIVIPVSQARHLQSDLLLDRVQDLLVRIDALKPYMDAWMDERSIHTLDQAERYVKVYKEREQRREAAHSQIPLLRKDIQKNYDAYFMAIGRRDGFHCQRCRTTYKLTIEHIIAVSNGGTNDLDNLQLLCLSCNCSKGDRES